MSLMTRMLTNFPLVNILFVVVLAMGLMSYLQMPREQDPEINFNWVNISTIMPGASAGDVERLITSPLEDAIGNVQDVRWVTSSSRESVSNILIRFRDISSKTFDKRINDLRREVQNKHNAELPEQAEDSFILEVTTSTGFPTALVVVVGQADDEVLRRQARTIKEDLQRLPGVNKVQSLGLHAPEIHIDFDPQALAARGLRPADVADSLRRSFRDTTAGTASVGKQQWLVRVEGTTTDPAALSEFRIAPASRPDARIALDTVARVTRGREEAAQLVTFDGAPAVSLSITKVAFINTIGLINRVNQYIESKNAQLDGSGIRLVLADDQTVQTRQAIGIMQTNAGLGLGLVLLVCWLFLGWRIAAMVTLGIVFSIAGTFWFLNSVGSSLNVSVLLGIVIVLGMLVDDAVVVVEAVYYRIQRGTAAIQAALAGLREVAAPVTSAVATTVAAFLPLMLLPGIVGEFMFIIPFVVTVGLLVSLVEAFWLLPSHVVGLAGGAPRRMAMLDWRGRWTHRLRIRYGQALCHVIRRPIRYLCVFLVSLVLAAGTLALGMVRFDFFTFDPIRLFYVNVDMPSDSSLTETLRALHAVEGRVRAHLEPAEARAVTALAGVKFTEMEVLFGDNYGQIQVSLNPLERGIGRQPSEVIKAMRASVQALPGDFEISFLELSGGPPDTRPISVKVRSDDFVELRAAADAVKTMVANIDGAKDVSDNDVQGRAELVLEVDHFAARKVGLDPGEVARSVQLLVGGEVIAFVRDQGEKVDLRVRARRGDRVDIEEILASPLAVPSGGSTTLGALVRQRVRHGRGVIRHFNLRRAITVSADLDSKTLDTLTANRLIQEAWNDARGKFPGADLDFSGELDDINESLDAMMGLFLLGLGLIYLILASQFRSYFQPLLILVTVPMAFTGVVFGLLLTGNPMSLYTLYGVIALTGIAVNSAIVLIDSANVRVHAGIRPLHATIYAARRRVVPILMTTFTTIAGLFSLAVGLGGKSLLWGPVASSIVAGLAFASLLTLFIVPMLYRLFMRGRGRAQMALTH